MVTKKKRRRRREWWRSLVYDDDTIEIFKLFFLSISHKMCLLSSEREEEDKESFRGEFLLYYLCTASHFFIHGVRYHSSSFLFYEETKIVKSIMICNISLSDCSSK